MYDRSLEATPRRRVLNAEMTSQNQVRVLRSDPEGVTVQFRRDKDYTQVYLSFPQARLLADYLMGACDDALTPLPLAELEKIVRAESSGLDK